MFYVSWLGVSGQWLYQSQCLLKVVKLSDVCLMCIKVPFLLSFQFEIQIDLTMN